MSTTNEKIAHDCPLILVTGLTGAGKTTLINHVAGTSYAVGEGMKACTTTTGCIPTIIAGVPVILVDTPGFDEPGKTDACVLRDLTDWIKDNLGAHRKVTAAFYLHNIKTEKMHGSSLRNFILFQKLVGGKSMANVGLVTTKWDEVDLATGEKRELELSETDQAWKLMLQRGAQTYRACNTRESCVAIVRAVLEAQPTFMQIQTEMGKEKKPLSRTEAGEHVYQETLGRVSDVKSRIKEYEEMLTQKENAELKDVLQEDLRNAKSNLATYEDDLNLIKKTPTWDESAWTLTKTWGPTLASHAIGRAIAAGTLREAEGIIAAQAAEIARLSAPAVGGAAGAAIFGATVGAGALAIVAAPLAAAGAMVGGVWGALAAMA